MPTAWFSIDHRDNDAVEFVKIIIKGIQSIHNDIGIQSLELLNSKAKVSIEYIVELLINDILSVNSDLLLVLDDLHLIETKEIYSILNILITQSPGNFKTAILTRSDPPIGISRLRSQNKIIEIRSSDLSFTANDISELFNKNLKLGLNKDDIHVMKSKTEGWIAGLQLAAISLQGIENISEFISGVAGNNRYIMDYLMEEVMNTQNDEMREFLLNTSILEKMSGSLCDAVLGKNNSQEFLEKLEKSNMFIIPLDNERQWFRYHHLFGDLLKQRQLKSKKDSVSDIHNKASIWFEMNAIPILAIDHSLKANNIERASSLIDKQADSFWLTGEHTLLQRYLEELPTSVIATKPKLIIYYSWILFMNGKYEEAELSLQKAEQLFSDSSDQEPSATTNKEQFQGRIFAIRASLASFRGEITKTIQFSEQALKLLSKQDDNWRCIGAMTLGDSYMLSNKTKEAGKAYFEAVKANQEIKDINLYLMSNILFAYSEVKLGKLQSAYEIYEKLTDFINRKGLLKTDYAGWVFSAKGHLFYAWNDIENALENVNKSIEMIKHGHNVFIKGIVYNNLITILYATHDLIAAEKALQELENIVEKADVPKGIISLKESWKARLWLDKGNMEAVSNWVKERSWNESSSYSYLHKEELIVFARILIAKGKYDAVNALLKRLISEAESSSLAAIQIELLLIHARVLVIKNNEKDAEKLVLKALSIAEPGSFIRFFINESDAIEPLVKNIINKKATQASDELSKISKDYLNKLNIAFELERKRKNLQSDADLSSRELEILKLISEKLTNKEICETLFISLPTVKTHISNILLKLEAKNRIEATEIAKEKGLV